MTVQELRIGNYIDTGVFHLPMYRGNYMMEANWFKYSDKFNPIPLTEEWLLKFGFSVINENSAGKRYGYVIGGVFSSDLTFTFWKTTIESGKFFRRDLELKSVHQLQNLYFALTNEELTLKQ